MGITIEILIRVHQTDHQPDHLPVKTKVVQLRIEHLQVRTRLQRRKSQQPAVSQEHHRQRLVQQIPLQDQINLHLGIAQTLLMVQEVVVVQEPAVVVVVQLEVAEEEEDVK